MLRYQGLNRRALLKMALYGFALTMTFAININSVFIMLIVLFWIGQGTAKQDIKEVFHNKGYTLLYILYFLYSISVFFSSDTKAALAELELKSTFLIFPLVFTSLKLTKEERWNYLNTFVLAVTVATLICLVSLLYKIIYLQQYRQEHAFLGVDWVYFSFHLPKQINFHSPYFSMYTMMSTIIIVYMLTKRFNVKKSIYKALTSLLLALYLFVFTVLLSSRTALVAGILILTAGFLVYFISLRKAWIAISLSFFILIGGIAGFKYIPYLKRKMENNYGITQRAQLWEASISLVSENLLTGVGSGDVKESLAANLRRHYPETPTNEMLDPHNQYLQLLLSLGIFGMLVYLLYICYLLYFSIRHSIYILSAVALLFMLCGLTESNLQTQKGIIFFSFLTTLLVSPAAAARTAKISDK